MELVFLSCIVSVLFSCLALTFRPKTKNLITKQEYERLTAKVSDIDREMVTLLNERDERLDRLEVNDMMQGSLISLLFTSLPDGIQKDISGYECIYFGQLNESVWGRLSSVDEFIFLWKKDSHYARFVVDLVTNQIYEYEYSDEQGTNKIITFEYESRWTLLKEIFHGKIQNDKVYVFIKEQCCDYLQFEE